MAIIITSEQTVTIDEPFKVCAGPGAGKTHWLINHIKNVVSNSHKLDVVKKVACITYTNVGTDTIISRLNIGNDIVEVCTIHSFLYANVVKPYVHLVSKDFGLKLEDLVVIDDSNFKSEGTAVVVLNRMKKSWLDAKIYLKGCFFSGIQFEAYPAECTSHADDRFVLTLLSPCPDDYQ